MKRDLLAEATNGREHWDDPGADAFETGWEIFSLGTRVEIRTEGDVWRVGTVVETWDQNDRAFVVECDERWHNNLNNYAGHGAVIMVYMNTYCGIRSNIRLLDE